MIQFYTFEINCLLPFLVGNRLISCRINKRWDEFNFFIVIYTAKASFNKYHSEVLKNIKIKIIQLSLISM